MEALRDDCAGRLNVLYLSVSRNRVLAMRYRVRDVPTFIFFDASGAEVRRLEGQTPAATVERLVGRLANAAPPKQ